MKISILRMAGLGPFRIGASSSCSLVRTRIQEGRRANGGLFLTRRVGFLARGLRFAAATDRKLPNRALNVKVDPRHSRKQIDIDATNRTAAKSHGRRHQVEGLRQYANVFENKRIGDRAVFP